MGKNFFWNRKKCCKNIFNLRTTTNEKRAKKKVKSFREIISVNMKNKNLFGNNL